MKFGYHPINLTVRFILEVIAFLAPGFYAFNYFDGALGVLIGIGFPVLLMFIWGAFAVQGDKSRSGKTLFKTPGLIRLLIEFFVFGCGISSLWMLNMKSYATVYLSFLVLHYLLSMDRIKWLLMQK